MILDIFHQPRHGLFKIVWDFKIWLEFEWVILKKLWEYFFAHPLGQPPAILDHFMDIFSQFHCDPPRYEEKVLTPLKIQELLFTTPKDTKNGLVSPKNIEYGQYPPP